jgi:Rrf2 family protein
MRGVGRHTDYAMRILMHLAALEQGAHTQVKDIAQQRLLPAPFLRRVVARLAAAGILRTTRGNRGGVRLAQPAAAISLLDVVRAMEGGVVLNRCVSTKHACPLGGTCPVLHVWEDATRRVEEHLGGIAIADLADAQKKIAGSDDGCAQRSLRRTKRRRASSTSRKEP